MSSVLLQLEQHVPLTPFTLIFPLHLLPTKQQLPIDPDDDSEDYLFISC